MGLEGQQGSGLGKAATDPRVLLLWFSKSHWKGWAASVTWVCPDSNSRTQHRHQQLKNHHTIRRLFLCQSAVCVQVSRPPPLLTYWLHRQCVCDFAGSVTHQRSSLNSGKNFICCFRSDQPKKKNPRPALRGFWTWAAVPWPGGIMPPSPPQTTVQSCCFLFVGLFEDYLWQ